MEAADPKQDYWAKAREAEQHAAETTDSVMRNTWLRIAQSYRDLALFVQSKSSKGLSWELRSQSPDSTASTRNN